MRNILIIGAGRSSTFLIEYLLDFAKHNNYSVTIADVDLELASQKVNNHPSGNAVQFTVEDASKREDLIKNAQIVVSMLPAHMHLDVAIECVKQKKHLVTASYISTGMKALHDEAINSDVILLNEIGLDPGIDHMSAMKIIHELKQQGASITSFKSYCGGLVAPESNDNPWGYKFSWNPRNVILAGQSTAQYLQNTNLKFVPYGRIFSTANTIHVDQLGELDAYPNRDSLSYIQPYELDNIRTMIRGTLRHYNYCKAWNVFVQLGLCDDTYKMDASNLTYKKLVESFLPESEGSIIDKLKKYCNADKESIEMLEFTGILSDEKIGKNNISPAEILQNLLEQKWKLQPNDKDMIVMVHEFEYALNGAHKKLQSSLVVKGNDSKYTAMAKTVGLPAAIAVKLILQGEIKLRGVHMPIVSELYEPILSELSTLGITFTDKIIA